MGSAGELTEGMGKGGDSPDDLEVMETGTGSEGCGDKGD